MKLALTLGALAATAVASAASAGVIYSTGVDTSEGYTFGDINGQNGWSTFQPGAGGGFANVTGSAPSGFGGDGALQFNSGTDANTSPRYAGGPTYDAAWQNEVANGNTIHYTTVSMYLGSGQNSTARLGSVTFDSTGTKILSGFYVQANTGAVYMLGYYNNAGTLNNFAFNTNATIGFNQWVTFTTTWDSVTGQFQVFWGSNGFYVNGAGAGSVASETDMYNTRNGSTTAATAYFDNLEIGAIPGPGALALLGVAGIVTGRRRR